MYIIIILFLILCIIIYSLHSIEKFETNSIILTNNPSNTIQKNVKYTKQEKINEIVELLSSNESIPLKDKNVSIIIDPLDYHNKLKGKYISNKFDEEIIRIEIDMGNFMYISKQVLSGNCTYNFENHIIGYLTQSDLYYIKAIIKGHRMFENTIKLKQLNPITPNFENVDFVVTNIVKKSKLYKLINNLSLYVYGFTDIDINRIRLFYPFVKSFETDLNLFFNETKTLKLEKKKTNIPSLSMILLSDIKTSYKEDFITRLNIHKSTLDSEYGCYNDERNQNRALCNSSYDEVGDIKSYESLWDKKCKKDEECPFYQSNKNYPNNRGGCIKKYQNEYGSCEMPIGIKQIGYRKYYDKGDYRAFCYGKDGECEGNYDYAFENDQEEREANKKEIIINM